MPDRLSPRNRIILILSLFLLALVTRIPFASKFLYHLDSVNFALALNDYDISVHQPHPPGYFLYVMLGRFINVFVEDPNTVFVAISVLFSGLTVVAVYLLGEEMFDFKAGVWAAVIALTSPNIWFHGEVALTYIVEACVGTLIALWCWKVLEGEEEYLWVSAIALGLAGGLRQNTPVFLLPLWLYSVRRLSAGKVCASILILALVSLAWFVPMLGMTGGWDSYYGALRELWSSNTGRNSVFSLGWAALKFNVLTVLQFTILGVGAWLYVLCVGAYARVRNGKSAGNDNERITFLALWAAPSIVFYLLVFIHPGNPGYALVFIPAFVLMCPLALQYLVDRNSILRPKPVYNTIACLLCAINVGWFLFVNSPSSYRNIARHDRDIKIVMENLRTFDSSNTVLFGEEYLLFGFRHLMYYLPEYRTYMVDLGPDRKIRSRDIFSGVHGKTFRSRFISLEGDNAGFAAVVMKGRLWEHPLREWLEGSVLAGLVAAGPDQKIRIASKVDGVDVRPVTASISIVSGPVTSLCELYPELEERIVMRARPRP